MRKIGMLLLLALLPLLASAGHGPGAVRKQIESSMLVTGTIMIGPAGEVVECALDQPDKLPEGVRKFVEGNAARWEFEPVRFDGKPVSARNKMSVRVVARKLEAKGSYEIRLQGASFQPMRVEEGAEVASRQMQPPKYPMTAARAGVMGTVYLVARVGRDGRVADVFPEQVNLKVVASENAMQAWRKVLADSAMRAAKDWEFTPPSKGEHASDEYWSVRVPVDYAFDDTKHAAYGEWEAYVPGPRASIPWQDLRDLPGYSPDTQIAGSVQMVGGEGGLKLLTPLMSPGGT